MTADVLVEIMPDLSLEKAKEHLPFLLSAMAEAEINTPLRAAAFLAQLAHESGQLKYFEEIWGPTAQQLKYEPPSKLAKRLGNIAVGDGKRFRGRGPIQLTGRSNYNRYGVMLKQDFISDPALVATPTWGYRVAALYWTLRNINNLADRKDFRAVTKAINGGYHGLAMRAEYYKRALTALEKVYAKQPEAQADQPVSDSTDPKPSS